MTPATHLPQIWDGTTLAVLDVETTQDPDGGFRIVDIAVITLQNGTHAGNWSRAVNPTIPIDAESIRIHNIRDEDVADAPKFKDIAEGFLERVTPENEHDPFIIVAHSARFDIPIIRAELERVGESLPYVPVLDTQGDITNLAGLDLASSHQSLETLCAALGVPFIEQHTAQADARVLSSAVTELLERAGSNGRTIDEIIDVCTTPTLATDFDSQIPHISPMRTVSKEHQAQHDNLHRKDTTSAQELLITCGQDRCHLINDTTDILAAANTTNLIDVTEHALHHHADADAVVAVATIVNAATQTFATEFADASTRMKRSRAAAAYTQWTTALTRLTSRRCPTAPTGTTPKPKRCMPCSAGDPCPLDTWVDEIARIAVGRTDATVLSFYDPQPGKAASSSYAGWINSGLHELAQAGIAHVIDHHEHDGDITTADRIANRTYQPGTSNHPGITTRYTQAIARAGTTTVLTEAHKIATRELAHRNGSRSLPWRRLAHVAASYANRLNPQPGKGTVWRARIPGAHKRRYPKRFTT